MSEALATQQIIAVPANVDDSPLAVFERLARDPNVPVEKLERLVAMQERINEHVARSAFNEAFAALLGELPIVREGGRSNNGAYARFEDIVQAVRPYLRHHGFALSHSTEWPDAKTVRVIGILTHKGGHERRSEFLSAADSSGSKNAIQGLGSAMSYGRRYTTLDLLNIATSDDDGAGTSTLAPDAPNGFESWWDDLSASADNGTAVLEQAWKSSSPVFRKHAMATRSADWNKLKMSAAHATKAAAQ